MKDEWVLLPAVAYRSLMTRPPIRTARLAGKIIRKNTTVLGVVALAVALSCAMHWVPVLNTVSSGFSIILCTVLAAGLGALAAPVPDEPSGAPDGEVA